MRTTPQLIFARTNIITRVPKDDKKRVGKLREATNRLIQLSVNNGNEITFQHAHARLMQTIAEVTAYIELQCQDGEEVSSCLSSLSIVITDSNDISSLTQFIT